MMTHPDDVLPLAGRLRALFRKTGYTADGVDALLGPVASAALGRNDLVPALQAASGDSPLAVLVRLFLLGRDEPEQGAAFLPAEVLEPVGSDRVRAALDLRPHESDWWVAADASGRTPTVDHVIGIGAASTTLLAATLSRPADRALDIGTGCGIQALHLTRTAQRVTATDAVPRAVAMARLSFALSGLEPDAVELLTGDLLSPVAGREFELVVCNPPFVLAPPGPDALAYRDAADDGQLARLLGEAAMALAPGGVAELLTSWVIRAGESWQEPPAGMLPSGGDALVTLREILDPAEHVALWRDDKPEPGATQRALRWLEHVQRLGAEGIAYGMVVLRRTDAEPRLRFLDLRAERKSPTGRRLEGWLDRAAIARECGDAAMDSLHLRVAGDVRLIEESEPGEGGWTPVQRHLTRAAALPETVAVDPTTAALLAGCDGQLPLGAIAELLAVATGAPADGVRRVARQLYETGHLEIHPPHDVSPTG